MELILSVRYREASLDFSELYEREFARVYRATWLFGRDEDTALEATQEAFAKAWARWPRLRNKEWIVGWLIKTSHNEVRRNARKRAMDEGRESYQNVALASVLDLRRALHRLPPRRRQALVLFYIGDLPVSGVAEVMDASEGTVKAHLAQGRAALKELLEDADE